MTEAAIFDGVHEPRERRRIEGLLHLPLEVVSRPARRGPRLPPPVDTSTAGVNVAALMAAITTGEVR